MHRARRKFFFYLLLEALALAQFFALFPLQQVDPWQIRVGATVLAATGMTIIAVLSAYGIFLCRKAMEKAHREDEWAKIMNRPSLLEITARNNRIFSRHFRRDFFCGNLLTFFKKFCIYIYNGRMQVLGRKIMTELELVRQDPMRLEGIENQTIEICEAAVEKDVYALQHVKEQWRELCLAAIERDENAFFMTREKTPEICMAAVRKNGWLLKHIDRQTDEICMAAVENDFRALRWVKRPTPEICAAGVRQDYHALAEVAGQTAEICLAAVEADYRALQYARFQTPEVCMAAIRQNGMSLRFVRPENQTPEVFAAAVERDPRATIFERLEKANG